MNQLINNVHKFKVPSRNPVSASVDSVPCINLLMYIARFHPTIDHDHRVVEDSIVLEGS